MAAEQTERDAEAKANMVWQSQPFLTLKGHTSYVLCVAWSPKGDQLASGSKDESIIIWDAASGAKISVLKGLRGLAKYLFWALSTPCLHINRWRSKVHAEKLAASTEPHGLYYPVPGAAGLLSLRLFKTMELHCPVFSNSPLPAPKFRLKQGTLPRGVTLNLLTGALSGTPKQEAQAGQQSSSAAAVGGEDCCMVYPVTVEAFNIKGSCSCNLILRVETHSAPSNLSYEGKVLGTLVQGETVSILPHSLTAGLPATEFKVQRPIIMGFLNDLESRMDSICAIALQPALAGGITALGAASKLLRLLEGGLVASAETECTSVLNSRSVKSELAAQKVEDVERELQAISSRRQFAADQQDYEGAIVHKRTYELLKGELDAYKTYLGVISHLRQITGEIKLKLEMCSTSLSMVQEQCVAALSGHHDSLRDQCLLLSQRYDSVATWTDENSMGYHGDTIQLVKHEALRARNTVNSGLKAVSVAHKSLSNYLQPGMHGQMSYLQENIAFCEGLLAVLSFAAPEVLKRHLQSFTWDQVRNGLPILTAYVAGALDTLDTLREKHSQALEQLKTGSRTTMKLLEDLPALPDGLIIDKRGCIFGTPKCAVDRWGCTVIVFNESGECRAEVTLTVSSPAAPSNLQYPTSSRGNDSGILLVGESVSWSPCAGVAFGNPTGSFSISPELPEGLSLSVETGVISGRPCRNRDVNRPQQEIRRSYRVSLSNSYGKCEVEVVLEVQLREQPLSLEERATIQNLVKAERNLDRNFANRLQEEIYELKTGKPIDAALGLNARMCVDMEGSQQRSQFFEFLGLGLPGIEREVRAFASCPAAGPEHREVLELLNYIIYEPTSEREYPNGVRDKGRNGMRLADFLQHNNVRVAGLCKEEVVALRLYTTSAFRFMNNPLRDDERRRCCQPCPLAVTTHWAASGIRKLRAIQESTMRGTRTLWRGMKSLKVADGFMQELKGGTEMAFLSTSTDLTVAVKYSLACKQAILFKMIVPNFISAGADLQWLSAFPSKFQLSRPPPFSPPT